MSAPSLVEQAMTATVDPEWERARSRRGGYPGPRTVPPQRRGGTCFAGWSHRETTAFVRYLVARVGIDGAAELCGVARQTIRAHHDHVEPCAVTERRRRHLLAGDRRATAPLLALLDHEHEL